MVSQALSNLGIIEFMQLLQELHKLGYQKLRWFSYVSPNGCALRCYITTQDNIIANREILHLSNDFAGAYSTGLTSSWTDIKPLIRTFLDELSTRLLDKGKGEDPEYVAWFNQIVDRAISGNIFPLF